MLQKLLDVHKLKPFSRWAQPKQVPEAEAEEGGCSSILKIVHAGGYVESYYMAIPAAKILEKYPSFLLARPEVFRRPWDSVVKHDEMLTPGQKLHLVPHRTVRKLRRRIRRPNKEFSVNSFVSQTSVDVSTDTSLQRKQHGSGAVGDRLSDTSICSIIRRKRTSVNVGKKHVTFSGIDVKHKCKSGDMEYSSDQTSSSSQSPHVRKRRVRSGTTWQPSLTAITETQGADHLNKS